MTPDGNTIATTVGVIITGLLTVWTTRSAGRTKRQEKRDDFALFVNELKEQIGELKKDQAKQQDQITGQGAAISWLVVDRRSLVSTIRNAGLKPPVPRPIPERARPYLDSIEL